MKSFIFLRVSVCTLLELNEHWSGHARILEQLQKERFEATMTLITDIARDHKAGIALTEAPTEAWLRKPRELYFLLKLRFTVHVADLCKDISNHNGFEVFRRLSCSYAPHADGQDMALLDQANWMRDSTAKTFDQMYQMLKKYDRVVKQNT